MHLQSGNCPNTGLPWTTPTPLMQVGVPLFTNSDPLRQSGNFGSGVLWCFGWKIFSENFGVTVPNPTNLTKPLRARSVLIGHIACRMAINLMLRGRESWYRAEVFYQQLCAWPDGLTLLSILATSAYCYHLMGGGKFFSAEAVRTGMYLWITPNIDHQ